MCLLYLTELSNDSMHSSKLKYHLKSKHKDKKDKSLDYFKKTVMISKEGLLIFSKYPHKKDKDLITSYTILKLKF